MSVNLDYGVKDIKTLEGIEAIRLRPGMYIGSVGPAGVQHITLEIISNAVDEYLNGHCTECHVNVSNDNIIEIVDNGRGVPFGKAEDGSETLVNVYTKLHTGAKFDKEAQEQAFLMTFNAVSGLLTEESKKYLNEAIEDLDLYIKQKIESEVNINKTIIPN